MWKPGRGDWRSIIHVEIHSVGDPHVLTVTVEESGGSTTHRVSVSQEDVRRLGAPGETLEGFIHRCFEFLLDREPKESILKQFDVSAISIYFPEFEVAIRQRH
jgi:hypothetical protein